MLYFRYSTNGLKVGAPVVLKGVQIGIVKDIAVTYDEASGRFMVPVHIEIDQDQVQWPGEIRGELDGRELLPEMLRIRCRRQRACGLVVQSPQTGSGNGYSDIVDSAASSFSPAPSPCRPARFSATQSAM